VRITHVTLHDRRGTQEIFRAECDATILAEIAERVLTAAHAAVMAAAGPSGSGAP